MKTLKIKSALLFMFVFSGLTATAIAADGPKDPDDWRFDVNVYGWLPSAPAVLSVDGVSAEMPEDLNKILDDLRFFLMLELEAHKGRWGLFAAPIWYDGKDTEHFTGPLGEQRKLTLKETVFLSTYGVSYDAITLNFIDDPDSATLTLQPFVGGFYFHDPIKIKIDPGADPILQPGVDIKKTIDFNIPIAGLNTLWNFNDRLSMRLGAYVGAGVDDVKSLYNLTGNLAWHWNWGKQPWKIFGGYRYLKLHYKDEPLDIKVKIEGPLVGVGFEF